MPSPKLFCRIPIATHLQGNSNEAQSPGKWVGTGYRCVSTKVFFFGECAEEEQQEGRDGDSSGSLLGIPPRLHREEVLGLPGQSRRSH